MRYLRVEASERRWPAAPLIMGGLGLAGALVALLHLDHLPFSVCMFKMMTGLPCMTCGTTRALGQLAVLHPLGALRINPLATVVLCGLLVYASLDLVLLARRRALVLEVGDPGLRWLWILAGALVLVNWAYMIATGV